MNHGADRSLVDPQSKGEGSYKHRNFIGHPALLVTLAIVGLHLAVVGNCGHALVFEESHGLVHAVDGGSVDDHVAAGMFAQSSEEKQGLRAAVALPDGIAQVGAMEAGDVLIWIAQAELVDDVMADAA